MASKSYSVPAGTYNVSVSKTGYVTKSESVTISNSDKTVNISLIENGHLILQAESGQTLPSGTTVTVKLNGAVLGTGNRPWSEIAKLYTESGTYEVTATIPGYKSFSKTTQVADGEVKYCTIDLSALKYKITVTASPDDATITVKDSAGTTIPAN